VQCNTKPMSVLRHGNSSSLNRFRCLKNCQKMQVLFIKSLELKKWEAVNLPKMCSLTSLLSYVWLLSSLPQFSLRSSYLPPS